MIVKRRLDDKGMTLVELLVAIVILAIIVVPLLHAFVSSARVNMSSRKNLRVTTTAQDVMEGLRADTLEELALQIHNPSGTTLSGNAVRDGFRIIDRALVTGSISENRCTVAADGSVSGLKIASASETSDDDKPCITTTDGMETYEFHPKSDGKYYFTMTDVTVDTGGTSNYNVDVLVMADATKYRSGGSASVSYNSTPIVDISDMRDVSDFVIELKEKDLLTQLNGAFSTSYTMQDVYLKVDIELKKVNVSGSDRYKIEATYSIISKANSSQKKEESIVITKDDIRNIYLFYHPTYNGKTIAANTQPDEINFVNNDLLDNNFYIVKQYDSSLSFIDTWEDAYRCKVDITETGSTTPHTRLRTNLDYNLRSVMNNATLGGTGEITEMATRQATYIYNTAALTEAEIKDIKGQMGGSQVEDRFYDVKVYVYDKGSISAALSGSGDIPASKMLISLEGSMR